MPRSEIRADRSEILGKVSHSEVLQDYSTALRSRQASLVGRKEVLSGKAKFGIFGDGKEVAQLALARAYQNGDWRSGYYRDQTLAFALGVSNIRQLFAQLYADADLEREPASAGRQMNSHFATRYLDQEGNWLDQLAGPNMSSDISPTGAQMARVLGLAYASKLYRNVPELNGGNLPPSSAGDTYPRCSAGGNEIAFATIGNASTSEGVFWECLNAAGVLQVPLLISVWDDGYGISVPAKFQTTKESISDIIAGFTPAHGMDGIDIHVVPGWDYPALVRTYAKAAERVRTAHVPALVHVTEMTQPQGHSTSGSHERYKSRERLAFEETMDCLRKMREWIIAAGIANPSELDRLEEEAKAEVEKERRAAWQDYLKPLHAEREAVVTLLDSLCAEDTQVAAAVESQVRDLKQAPALFRRNIQSVAKQALYAARQPSAERDHLVEFVRSYADTNQRRYSSHLLSESPRSPLHVTPIAPRLTDEMVDGRLIIQKFFDHALGTEPRLFIVGEDVGQLGGVNLEFEGLAEKHGLHRVTDTGIREATILGQGIGAAMRGLRPIVDIQYLDYLLYCFQIMSDDLATLHYRSAGGQIAPVIVRTKGHRLEGIWHTGSPMGTILHGIRGMHVCVPRDMTRAAGFYGTLLRGDDPALVIEVLNGYRVKEPLPANIGEYRLPLGVIEVLRPGTDITLVTYGACVRIAAAAAELLDRYGISVELIDVQTLLPFDIGQQIAASVRKTNALLCLDEDVPGGASSYMLQQIIENQGAYDSLDAPPRTLAARAHRSAYASDGDYYSKPGVEDIFEAVYAVMHERDPQRYPALPI